MDAPAQDGLSTGAALALDDEGDREELRRRYGMLLQELRVLLPGVQLLVAFLLTAPFAQGFDRVDDTGRVLYGIALTAGVLAVLAFTTPIALHRFGVRGARAVRLHLAIESVRVGIAFVGIALLCAFWVVCRLIYSPSIAAVLAAVIAGSTLVSWVALPQVTRTGALRRHRPGDG